MVTDPLSKRFVIAGTALIAAMVLIAYLPAFRGGFVWDDHQFVLKGPVNLSQIWTFGVTPQYYPLVFTSLWIERKFLWGADPAGYHAVNVILHLLNSLLLWRVLKYLRVPGSWLAAAIFSIHPVHVESVAWISERKNVLSGFFYFLSVLVYLRFIDRKQGSFYAASLILFVCALLSKTVTCTMPAVMLLLIWWKKNSITRRDVVVLIPFFVIGLISGFNTAGLEEKLVGARGAVWDFSFLERCLIAGRAIFFYLGKLIWPHPLIFNYPRWMINSGLWWQYLFPVAVLAVVSTLGYFHKRFGKGLVVAALFFIGNLFPALGFVNVYPMQYSFVADHFQYFASIGPIVLFANILNPQRVFRQMLAGILLAVFFLLSWQQAHIYQSYEILWRDTLRKNSLSWMAHNNLAGSLILQGKIEEGVAHYHKVLELKPDYYKALFNLGVVAKDHGRIEESLSYYRRALEIKPDYAKAFNNIGEIYYILGKRREAEGYFSKALEIKPDFQIARKNLNVLLAEPRKS